MSKLLATLHVLLLVIHIIVIYICPVYVFSQLLSLVYNRTKMNWLGFGVKSSNVPVGRGIQHSNP